MQRTGQLNKFLRLVTLGKKWYCFSALLLLSAAWAVRADELPANEKAFLAAVQQNQKLERRDMLMFFHENLGPRNHSNVSFSVRPDYYHFALNDQFTPRQEPAIAGIKATFSF